MEVAFGPRNLGFSGEQVQALVKDALAMTELSDKTETNPYDLSAHLAQDGRAGIGHRNGYTHRDLRRTNNRTGCNEHITHRKRDQNLRERGKTVITITHDIDFCAENFERVIAMSQGKILLDGKTNDVLGQDEILATTYVDPPQLTRLGKRLGFKNTVRNQEEFLAELKNNYAS